ncbi:hypothetical protein Prudu_006174 [Prunus dulcis]|uniref:Secreted protein n=1 Tax=Prunus dulcis TaxID=3755 RepID=A0A4Y1QZ90_PRUDU|nr:hypothetical protein Prudu_006174 [Prunus dulcis]
MIFLLSILSSSSSILVSLSRILEISSSFWGLRCPDQREALVFHKESTHSRFSRMEVKTSIVKYKRIASRSI